MLQVKALKSFQSRYGFIRAGAIFTAEPKYIQQLAAGMVEIVEVDEIDPSKPQRHQAFKSAPLVKSETIESLPLSSAAQKRQAEHELEPMPEDGPGRPSLSSQAVRPVRRRTRTTSEDDAK